MKKGESMKISIPIFSVIFLLLIIPLIYALSSISFVFPTPADNISTANKSIQINVSLFVNGTVNEIGFNWNGTNYTLYDETTVLHLNLDIPFVIINDREGAPKFITSGGWSRNYTGQGYNNELSYRYGQPGNPDSIAIWNFTVPRTGEYFVYIRWKEQGNRATNAPYNITHDGGNTSVRVNQEVNGSRWNQFGKYHFTVGKNYPMTLTNDANEYVIADAMMLVYADDASYSMHELIVSESDVVGQGRPDSVSGRYNNAWYFDGVSDSVRVTTTQPKTTVAFWYKNSTASSWTHVVNVSGTLYTNGIQGISPQEYPIKIQGNTIFLGNKSSGFFNGSIDEVRIFNRSLSAAEVYELYASNVHRDNPPRWYLYVNQSKSASSVLDPGNYTYFAWMNDLLGELLTEKRTIMITGSAPPAPPVVTIVIPGNNTNTTNNQQDVNYTVVASTLDSCWYSNDTYTVNTSLGAGGTCANITSVVWNLGPHNVTVYVNDSQGVIAQSTISFTITGSAPPAPSTASLIFVFPTPAHGTSTTNKSFFVNVSILGNINGITYNWHGLNTTLFDAATFLHLNFDTPILVINDREGAPNFTTTDTGWQRNYTGQGYNNELSYRSMGDGSSKAIWNFTIPRDGAYDVYARWHALGNRATNAPYNISHDGGTTLIRVNQEVNGSRWNKLGRFNYTQGKRYPHALSNDANEWVIADAMMMVYVDDASVNKHEIIISETDVVGQGRPDSNVSGRYSNGWYFDGQESVSIRSSQTIQTVSFWFKDASANASWVNVINTSGTIYVNGVANAPLPNYPVSVNSTTIVVGKNATSTFNGIIDEVRVLGASLSSSEAYQWYASNLHKHNATSWHLFVNQSQNASTGLNPGNYTYFASAKDNLNNEALSEIRSISIL